MRKAIMKSSSLFWKYFRFISFFHLCFNRLYHMGNQFNLLNTCKIYFKLVSHAPHDWKILLWVYCWEKVVLQSGMLLLHQQKKRATEDEMVGWHHQFNGHELGKIPRANKGQGRLASYHPWDHKESDRTWQLNNNNNRNQSVSLV